MARRPEQDSRITDLRRYRRERERAQRAERASRKQAAATHRPGGPEPVLGRRRNAGLILAAVVVVLAILGLLSGHRF